MNDTTYPPFRPFLAAAITLFVLGAGLFAVAVFALEPTVWPRWLLFFGGTLALTGLALPAAWFLNLRFPSDPPAGVAVVLRQAIWVGVYGVLLAWLQQARLVSLWSGLGLAGGLVAIEYLIRMREKARWSPPLAAEPTTAAAREANPGGDPPDQPNG